MSDVTDLAVPVGSDLSTDMTKEEAATHTELIKAAIESFNEKLDHVGSLLVEAQRRKAWKALGYETWEAYTRAEFHMGRSRAYQYIDQAKVVLALEQAIDNGNVAIPRLTTEQVTAVKEDLAEVVSVVQERAQEASDPEEVAEIVQEVVQETTKNRRNRRSVTPVQRDVPVDVEIVDGEIVLEEDGKTGHLETCCNNLVLLLEQFVDFPEPEELIKVMTPAQLDRVMHARLWLLRFPVEIPA